MSSSLSPLVDIDDNKKKFARRQSTASTIGMGGLEVDVDAVDRAGQAGAHGSVYTRYLSQFYKTKLCKYHLDGYCNRGDNCTHAHSVSELECQPDLSKARMCRTLLQKGHCDVTNCAYAHDLETVKSSNAFFRTKMCDFAKRGFCKLGTKCRYAHSEEEIIKDVAPPTPTSRSEEPHPPNPPTPDNVDDTASVLVAAAVAGENGSWEEKKLTAIHGRRRRRGKVGKSHTAPSLEHIADPAVKDDDDDTPIKSTDVEKATVVFERPPPVYTGRAFTTTPTTASSPEAPLDRNAVFFKSSPLPHTGPSPLSAKESSAPGSAVDPPSSRMYYYYPSPLPGFTGPGGPFSNTTPYASMPPLPPNVVTMKGNSPPNNNADNGPPVAGPPRQPPCVMYMMPVAMVPMQKSKSSGDFASFYPRGSGADPGSYTPGVNTPSPQHFDTRMASVLCSGGGSAPVHGNGYNKGDERNEWRNGTNMFTGAYSPAQW
ncbi:hypothetical protein FOZ62_027345 [Perkinsus olseni]|uniref:C3H1-type domain-containing protein n=1 Tax=Perkinsus olseni TaxID=32597 RepID=A0A7J6QVU2_PEROL|nr:hypothetical protein FOZ62_027345 [Perkinsus olseni]